MTMSSTVFLFQNCGMSDTELQFASSCVLGKTMQIEQILDNGTPSGVILNKADIVVYKGDVSAVEQYGYSRLGVPGADPLVTPPSSRELKIMFYEDSAGLNFTFYVNENNSGSAKVHFDVNIKGNLLQDRALVRDEARDFRPGDRLPPEEFAVNPRGYIPVPGLYTADLTPGRYTDGGVIGPIEPGVDFEMTLQFLDEANVKKAMFHSAEGASYVLGDEDEGQALTSFRIKYKGYETCTNVYR